MFVCKYGRTALNINCKWLNEMVLSKFCFYIKQIISIRHSLLLFVYVLPVSVYRQPCSMILLLHTKYCVYTLQPSFQSQPNQPGIKVAAHVNAQLANLDQYKSNLFYAALVVIDMWLRSYNSYHVSACFRFTKTKGTVRQMEQIKTENQVSYKNMVYS